MVLRDSKTKHTSHRWSVLCQIIILTFLAYKHDLFFKFTHLHVMSHEIINYLHVICFGFPKL